MKKVSAVSKISVGLIFLSTVFYYGCKKDRIQQTTMNSYDSPDPYLDSKEPEEQEFIIDSTDSGPITGNQGTKVWAGKNCLMYANGDTVIYPFTIKLVELYKPKDMIYYRMPTVASGNILRTAGEIRLRAFKDSVELMLKPNPCFTQIEIPSATPPRNDMRVFYGFPATSSSIGFTDWTDDPSKLGTPSTLNPVFTATANSYTAPIARLGWINCGVLANSASSASLSFTSSVDELTNVKFFIYLPDTKTVMQVYGLTSGDFPSGSNIKIIGIGMQGSNLFSFYETLSPNGPTNVDVEMKATSDGDLTALLDGL